jgi:hypothetical protein
MRAERHGQARYCSSLTLGHRRVDETWTYGIDTNAPCGIFQGRAFGEAKDAVLGSMICSTPGSAHNAADRRAVDDSTTLLLAHLTQLELHAAPDASEVDRHHSIEIFRGRVSGFRNDILNTGYLLPMPQ